MAQDCIKNKMRIYKQLVFVVDIFLMRPILIIHEFSQSNPSHFFELGQTLFFSVRKCRTRNLSNRRRAIFVCFLKLSRAVFKFKFSRQIFQTKEFLFATKQIESTKLLEGDRESGRNVETDQNVFE